jgi:NitT/TauT family transport system substrate-binding protein
MSEKIMMFRVLATVGLVFCMTGCTERDQVASGPTGSPSGASHTSVKLALNWYPEVEHGGFIAAETLGLCDEKALDVEIIPGGPGAPQLVISELAAERIDFAVSDADNVVKARSVGLPIVAVMATMQNSPRCIMVHESSGFSTLNDLANIELAISDSRPFALWLKKKLPLTNVTMIPFNGLVGEFLVKPNFAQQAFVFSEPFVAKEKGSDPQVLMVSDTGFNPYASVLITTEKMIADKPDVVESMVRASIEGWTRYLADPAMTNDRIHEMNMDMSPAALKFGAEKIAALCQPTEDVPLGSMTLERWQTLVQQIEEIEDIENGSVRPEECFTTRFVPE